MPNDTRVRFFLYEFWDRSGRALYVGLTDNPGRRLAQHARSKYWWDQVCRVVVNDIPMVEHREYAEVCERALIQDLNPRYNIVHNHGPFPEPPVNLGSTYLFILPEAAVEGMLLYINYNDAQQPILTVWSDIETESVEFAWAEVSASILIHDGDAVDE